MVKSVPVVFLNRPSPAGGGRAAYFDRSRKWGLGFICVSGILFEGLIVIARYILAVFSRILAFSQCCPLAVFSRSVVLSQCRPIAVFSPSRILAFSHSRILAAFSCIFVLSHSRDLAAFSRTLAFSQCSVAFSQRSLALFSLAFSQCSVAFSQRSLALFSLAVFSFAVCSLTP
jgi:hypothetical protein